MIIFSLNNKGFTLLEMLVAMVILMIGMLGLLATIDISIQQTTRNQLRELAVGVGEEQLRSMLSVPYDNLGAFSNATTASRTYRNGRVGFDVTKTVVALGSDTSELTITVDWKNKGLNQQHQIRSVKSR